MNRSVLLMRHGETEWNRAGRFQGDSDSPLTEIGRVHAERLRLLLDILPVDTLHISPLGRAQETARIMSRDFPGTIATDDDLREISFGRCAGLTRRESEERYGEILKRRECDKWSRSWPDGESYRDVDLRAGRFLDRLAAGPDRGVSGIVAHETVNRMLIGRLCRLDREAVFALRQPHDVAFRWCADDGLGAWFWDGGRGVWSEGFHALDTPEIGMAFDAPR